MGAAGAFFLSRPKTPVLPLPLLHCALGRAGGPICYAIP